MIVMGRFYDGRKFRQPKSAHCEHVWVDTHTDATHVHSQCSLCKRVKKRKVSVSKTTYKAWHSGVGSKVSGVPYRLKFNTVRLPTVLRGLRA